MLPFRAIATALILAGPIALLAGDRLPQPTNEQYEKAQKDFPNAKGFVYNPADGTLKPVDDIPGLQTSGALKLHQPSEFEAYGSEAVLWLNQSKFAALEDRLQQAVEGKQRFSDGGWKSFAIYESLSDCNRGADIVWQSRLKLLQAWKTAYPMSMSPRIALAAFYERYGWVARGGGFANTVTDEGWRLFKERLTLAANTLRDARPLGVRDPHYWRLYQDIARGVGEGSRPLMDEIYRQGIALEPQYWSLYLGQAFSLLPRWYGKPGEMEKFAEEATHVPGGPGPEIYARIAMYMAEYHRNIFRDTALQWPRVREGFDALLKSHPGNLTFLNEFQRMATQAGDVETNRRIALEIAREQVPPEFRQKLNQAGEAVRLPQK